MLLLLVSLLSLPDAASAADYNLCVTPEGSQLADACAAACHLTSSSMPTIASALAEAAALPDNLDASRPSVRICVTGVDYHRENIRIEQDQGRIAAPLTLETDSDTTLCGESSAPEEPLIYWQTNMTGSGIDQLSVTMDLRMLGPCAHNGPGVLVEQDTLSGRGHLTLDNTTIIGSSSYALSTRGSPAKVDIDLINTHIVNCQGAAVFTAGSLLMKNSEIVGCHLQPFNDKEASALVESTEDYGLQVQSTVFFGNLIDGEHLPQDDDVALLRGPLESLDRSLLAANVLTTGAPLVKTPLPALLVDIGPELGAWAHQGFTVDRSVISRNRHVESLLGHTPNPAEPAKWFSPAQNGLPHCAALDREHPYRDREAPASDAQSSNGPLFLLDGAASDLLYSTLSFGHSFLVSNEIGDGPLILVRSHPSGLGVQLLENTIADNGTARLLELSEPQQATEVIVARNLFVPGKDDTATQPLIFTAEPPESLTITMNTSEGPILWATEEAVNSALIGPNPIVAELEVIDPAELTGEDDCDRFKATCPSFTAMGCQQLPWEQLPCAVDTAVHWLPTSSMTERLGSPWPWQTDFFLVGAGGSAAPGATGGTCATTRLGYDSFSGTGDGDGYPDLVDCDNEDWDVQPAVPDKEDGYSSQFCDATEAPCFICPPGTTLGPESKDEDEAEPYPGSYHLVHSGCYQGGCGISYDCESSSRTESISVMGPLFFALIPLAIRRRR
jgi:hypothetical protein